MQRPHTDIRFTKMHGLGNDFVVIDAINQSFPIANLSIVSLSNRHLGIGFDQLLIIERSERADFFCRIFNADGSEAEQCGNGLRCVARFIREAKLITTDTFKIETKAGIFPVRVEDNDHIHVTFSAPIIQEKQIALFASPTQQMNVSILSLGNPHAIIKVDDIDMVQAVSVASRISSLDYFPNGTNVGFMQVIDRHHIRLRTIERGAGETFACGSNTCAAVCAGIVNGWLDDQVDVAFRYGHLQIEWSQTDGLVHMVGPASRVFSGVILAEEVDMMISHKFFL